jgi:hypothetical protein
VRCEFGGGREAISRVRSSHRSPHRGSGHQICLVEEEEGAEGSILPKVAAAESAGGSQNCRAKARQFGRRRSLSVGRRER